MFDVSFISCAFGGGYLITNSEKAVDIFDRTAYDEPMFIEGLACFARIIEPADMSDLIEFCETEEFSIEYA